jgi:hypothetical protein
MIELISVFSVLELGAVIKKGKIKILKTNSGLCPILGLSSSGFLSGSRSNLRNSVDRNRRHTLL